MSTPVYRLGSEPRSVPLDVVRRAASEGFALVPAPELHLIGPERQVYVTSGATGAPVLVAVLSAPNAGRLSPEVVDAIALARQEAATVPPGAVPVGMIRKGDVMNLAELAGALGVHEETMYRWRKLPSFPKPFKRGLWDVTEVRAWRRQRDSYRAKRSA